MLNGKARALGLKRAREKTAEARTLKADGKDPVGERRDQRTAAAVNAAKVGAVRMLPEVFVCVYPYLAFQMTRVGLPVRKLQAIPRGSICQHWATTRGHRNG
jgi:hypothetical protein